MRVLLLLALIAPFAADAAPRRRLTVDVTGTYTSTYDEVRLIQRGSLIEGEYVCCGGGRIEGRLVGRVIKYHWAQDGWDGSGVWRVVGTQLIGTWGSGDSEDDGGEWNLTRMDTIAN